MYTLAVQQLHPVLDGWMAVRDFREILFPHQLLLPHERAVVGGYHIDEALVDAGPQGLLVFFLPQRRAHHPFGAFEILFI